MRDIVVVPNYAIGSEIMHPLKFIVLDKDDLDVVSAHVQDAVVKLSDIHWRPKEKRLILALNRFDWECAQTNAQHDAYAPAETIQASAHEYRRHRSALRFERVLSCKCRNINPRGTNDVLNLLAVEFMENNTPGGIIALIFSGGAILRLSVECLEAELSDLGPSWLTATRPIHAEFETEPAGD